MKKIYIDGKSLTLEDIYNVAFNFYKIELTEESKNEVEACRQYVEELIQSKEVVYGLTTGFGKFSTIHIPQDQIEELQENLIISHATGVGNPYSTAETRAICLLRINVLAKGCSGIKLETLETLVEMLNKKVHPVIPEKGSVGASGDLAPLSHLALVLLGKGEAEYQGEVLSGETAMMKAGIRTVKLAAKEGLALNNGTQVMAAVGALTLLKAEMLCKLADVAAAMTTDALLGTPNAFDPLLHSVRPHKGQIESASNISKLLQGSKLRKSHFSCSNVQDPYSIRCSPQVNGAVRDTLAYVRKTLEIEINSATDNPLIFYRDKKVISGGNFHGEPLAIACDSMGIALSELANISERRVEQLLNPALNRGLNAFLAPRPGVDSGYMIVQLTAASLVSENKVLSHPASVDSIPTSANQEDHVSMGSISALKARQICDNTSYVLSIEIMIAAQGMDDRKLESSLALEKVKQEIRKKVPMLTKDRIFTGDMKSVKQLVDDSELINCVKKQVNLS